MHALATVYSPAGRKQLVETVTNSCFSREISTK